MQIKVLLIEDNLADARLFQELLFEEKQVDMELGFFHLEDIEDDTSKFLKEKNIDIVFLDLGLPSSSDVESVIKFRNINSHIPMVAYTGVNDLTFGAKLLNYGADDYLCKKDVTSWFILKTILLCIRRKELKEILDEKENMLFAQSKSASMGDMIGMIAHQWKQPLSILGMISNNMQLDLELGEEPCKENIIKNADAISRQVKYLSETIDDFRDFFKPNKNKIHYNVNNSINDTLKIVGKSIESHDIQIIKNSGEVENFEFLPNDLTQVLINILKNAKDAFEIKHVTDKKIIISTYQKNGMAIIDIEDNAGGIPAEILLKIFDAYFTTKDNEHGTGIGLYISKTIIKEHFKGVIKVENTQKGAKFSIILPIESNVKST